MGILSPGSVIGDAAVVLTTSGTRRWSHPAPSPPAAGFERADLHAVVDEPLALVGHIRVGLAVDMTRLRVGEPKRGLDAISARARCGFARPLRYSGHAGGLRRP
jgi:hypothetical protein